MTKKKAKTPVKREPVVDRYSVEFMSKDIFPGYVFKIRELTSSGMGILVKSDSALLNHIKVGKVMDLKYQTDDDPNASEYKRTEIKQVAEDDEGRFIGHHVIGLSILQQQGDSAESITA
ncbi:MAG: hypothetical protein V3S89_00125 [Desulfobacterales bacterium]